MHKSFVARLQYRIANTSIFTRIAIGNSAIIIVGAIGGTLITFYFTEQGDDLLPIIIFTIAGLTFSILLNLWILRAALKPLLALRKFISEAEKNGREADLGRLPNPDRDTTHLASSLSSLIKQLEASNQQLRTISSHAIRAQEEERKRIARSLHDDTGQALSNLVISLQRLEMSIPEDQARLKSRLTSAREATNSALNDLRQTIYGLRPSILDDLGLVPAIRWYTRSQLEEAGIQATLSAPEEMPNLPAEISTSLFRIAQEAINNVARHSKASRSEISITLSESEIHLVVQDNGCGFTTAGNQAEAIRLHHWGLLGIQERTDLISGQYSLETKPNKGTIIRISVPLQATKD